MLNNMALNVLIWTPLKRCPPMHDKHGRRQVINEFDIILSGIMPILM